MSDNTANKEKSKVIQFAVVFLSSISPTSLQRNTKQLFILLFLLYQFFPV